MYSEINSSTLENPIYDGPLFHSILDNNNEEKSNIYDEYQKLNSKCFMNIAADFSKFNMTLLRKILSPEFFKKNKFTLIKCKQIYNKENFLLSLEESENNLNQQIEEIKYIIISLVGSDILKEINDYTMDFSSIIEYLDESIFKNKFYLFSGDRDNFIANKLSIDKIFIYSFEFVKYILDTYNKIKPEIIFLNVPRKMLNKLIIIPKYLELIGTLEKRDKIYERIDEEHITLYLDKINIPVYILSNKLSEETIINICEYFKNNNINGWDILLETQNITEDLVFKYSFNARDYADKYPVTETFIDRFHDIINWKNVLKKTKYRKEFLRNYQFEILYTLYEVFHDNN